MDKIKNNINAKYLEKIDVLTNMDLSLREKSICIIEITEEYFYETDTQMKSYLLCLLTEWFLSDALKSKDVDKVSKSEYPILSQHQIKRRCRKQISVMHDTLDYLKSTNSHNASKNKRNELI